MKPDIKTITGTIVASNNGLYDVSIGGEFPFVNVPTAYPRSQYFEGQGVIMGFFNPDSPVIISKGYEAQRMSIATPIQPTYGWVPFPCFAGNIFKTHWVVGANESNSIRGAGSIFYTFGEWENPGLTTSNNKMFTNKAIYTLGDGEITKDSDHESSFNSKYAHILNTVEISYQGACWFIYNDSWNVESDHFVPFIDDINEIYYSLSPYNNILSKLNNITELETNIFTESDLETNLLDLCPKPDANYYTYIDFAESSIGRSPIYWGHYYHEKTVRDPNWEESEESVMELYKTGILFNVDTDGDITVVDSYSYHFKGGFEVDSLEKGVVFEYDFEPLCEAWRKYYCYTATFGYKDLSSNVYLVRRLNNDYCKFIDSAGNIIEGNMPNKPNSAIYGTFCVGEKVYNASAEGENPFRNHDELVSFLPSGIPTPPAQNNYNHSIASAVNKPALPYNGEAEWYDYSKTLSQLITTLPYNTYTATNYNLCPIFDGTTAILTTNYPSLASLYYNGNISSSEASEMNYGCHYSNNNIILFLSKNGKYILLNSSDFSFLEKGDIGLTNLGLTGLFLKHAYLDDEGVLFVSGLNIAKDKRDIIGINFSSGGTVGEEKFRYTSENTFTGFTGYSTTTARSLMLSYSYNYARLYFYGKYIAYMDWKDSNITNAPWVIIQGE